MVGLNSYSSRASIATSLLLCLVAFTVAAAQQKPSYTNPVIAGDFPDPSVIRVGEDYYATATTGTWAPHFPIMHSRDLVNWKAVGYVFAKRPAWARSDFWAPEIIEDRGRFFVYYTARRDEGAKRVGTLCVAVATAPAPAGPYTDRGALACEISERKNVGSIDAFFVRDEANVPHLVWKADGNDAEPDQPTSIFAQRLSDDGTRLVGKRKEIMRNDTSSWERHVVEGSYILRRGEWFYHFYSGNACCGRGCDYAHGVARSKKLLGPWEKHPNNPVIPANDVWQCPGHGSVVTTADGRDFLLYHAYRKRADAFSIGREALLDEINWGTKDGWPMINEGRGPSGAKVSEVATAGAMSTTEAEFFDDFDAAQLSPVWQWPMESEQTAIVSTDGGGRLVLKTTAAGVRPDDMAAAVVARRTTSGDYTATTVVDTRGMSPGAFAGLSAYSYRFGALGVAVSGGGKVVVWRRENRDHRTLAMASVPASSRAVHLRMSAAGGELYRLAVSADGGREWKELGDTAVAGAYVEGARVALTVGGAAGASGSFDSLRVVPSGAVRAEKK